MNNNIKEWLESLQKSFGPLTDSELELAEKNLYFQDKHGNFYHFHALPIEDWAATEEGQQAIKESKERGEKFAERIRKDMTIDREKLNRPFTR